jgi:hypothetical protein
MKKGADVLDISDINTHEIKTSIITNPETRANIEIEILKKKIESEKNKFLSDSAFVLRKYEEFNKVREEVTKAEHNYNRILGYSKQGDGNSDYWRNQLPFHKKSIDLAKTEVDKVIQKLAEKGVNVAEIEKQTQITDEKIAELDARLENLPEARAELVELYRLEKEEIMNRTANQDYAKERAEENIQLFKLEKTNTTQIIDSLREEKYEYQGIKR